MTEQSREPDWKNVNMGPMGTAAAHAAYKREHPMYFYPDGKPIVSDSLLDDTMIWALLFEETKQRIVGKTTTLYGESLSTVWLGLNHSFGGGPPLIFETMLFAPRTKQIKCEMKDGVLGISPEQKEDEAYIAKRFPHDQLQLRYATQREAHDMHETLKLHCLIPPRWRHFLLGTIGGWWMWKHYDEDEDLCR
jgi:hypothetical protein